MAATFGKGIEMNNPNQSEDWLSEFLQFTSSTMKDDLPASDSDTDSFDAFNMPVSVVVRSSSNEPLFDVEKRINTETLEDKLPREAEGSITNEMAVLDFPSGIMDIIGNETGGLNAAPLHDKLDLLPTLENAAIVSGIPMESVDGRNVYMAVNDLKNVPLHDKLDLLPTLENAAIASGIPMDSEDDRNLDMALTGLKNVPSTSFAMDMVCDSDSSTISRDIHIDSLPVAMPIGLETLSCDFGANILAETDVADGTSMVCPVFISSDNCSTNDVNIEDMELYLECNDDNESADGYICSKATSSIADNQSSGTSFIKSDACFKISFPIFPEERHQGFKCSVCKNYLPNVALLRQHISQDHKVSVNICDICTYNTKSNKLFGNHMKTKHKQNLNAARFAVGDEQAFYSNDKDTDKVTVSPFINISDKASGDTTVDFVTLIDPPRSYLRMKLNDSRIDADISHQFTDESITIGDTRNGSHKMKINGSNAFHQEIHMMPTNTCDIPAMKANDVNVYVLNNSERYALRNGEDSSGQERNDRLQFQTGDTVQSIADGTNEIFKCESCDFTTRSSKLLKRHMYARHDANREIFQCSQCDYSCKQKRSFDSHRKIHDESYDFHCNYCQKRFVTKTIYKRHLKIHENNQSLKCDIPECGKLFKMKGALTDHKKKVHVYSRPQHGTCDKGVNVNFREKRSKGAGNNKGQASRKSKDTDANGSRDSANGTHDSANGTHDSANGNHDSENGTPDSENGMHYSENGTYDSENGTHDSANGTHGSANGSCDSANGTHGSANGSQDSANRNRDSANGSLDSNKHLRLNNIDTRLKRCVSTSKDIEHRYFLDSPALTKNKTTSRRVFQCSFEGCGKRFRDDFNLKNHCKRHYGIKDLHCSLCPFVCIQKSSLQYHIKSKHLGKL